MGLATQNTENKMKKSTENKMRQSKGTRMKAVQFRRIVATALLAVAGTAQADGSEFPRLLRCENGREVTSVADWEKLRRREVAKVVLETEYGRLPAPPKNLKVLQVGSISPGPRYLDWLPGGDMRQLKVWCDMDGEPVTFLINVWGPAGRRKAEQAGKLPILIEGDGCWGCLTQPIIAAIVKRGWIVAQFNRCEVARDDDSSVASALLKWAWTYHRAIDALMKVEPRMDPARIAICGHSRGGKTVLLAGATDRRIAAVGDNCSGQGGSGPCRRIGEAKSESIGIITRRFNYWFAPTWRLWAGRENDLPFDQHFLLSLIAPRKLFTRAGRKDIWANPPGTERIVAAARPVWTLYGEDRNLLYSLREGGHGHTLEDYLEFLDFIERKD